MIYFEKQNYQDLYSIKLYKDLHNNYICWEMFDLNIKRFFGIFKFDLIQIRLYLKSTFSFTEHLMFSMKNNYNDKK